MNESNKLANTMIQVPTVPPTSDHVFALLGNNLTCREGCGVCGQSHNDAINPAAVFCESGSLCESCAKEMAPTLHRAAHDLEALHWIGDSESDRKIVLEAFDMFLHYSGIDWDNPPDHAELLKHLDQPAVRARIDELQRLYAERTADLPF
jgi:hypothetical protein